MQISTPSRIFTMTSRSLTIDAKPGARSYSVPGSSDDCSKARGGSAVTASLPYAPASLLAFARGARQIRASPLWRGGEPIKHATAGSETQREGADHGIEIDAPDRHRP